MLGGYKVGLKTGNGSKPLEVTYSHLYMKTKNAQNLKVLICHELVWGHYLLVFLTTCIKKGIGWGYYMREFKNFPSYYVNFNIYLFKPFKT
jgi:hypothetical protein